MASRVEDVVEYSCYGHTTYPNLKYNAGSVTWIPQLLRWDSVNNVCVEYEIEQKLKSTTYKILSKSNLIINVLNRLMLQDRV